MMIKKILLINLLTITMSMTLFAEKIVIEDILKANYSEMLTVEKKSLLLSKEEASDIQKKAEAKLDSKIVRLYTVKKESEVLGYGVMLSRKMRTKKATILYMFDNNQSMKAIEIIAFNEPLEYKPNSEWKESFKDKNSSDMLISGKDIPSISGATLSARAITDASRIALAIVALKKP